MIEDIFLILLQSDNCPYVIKDGAVHSEFELNYTYLSMQ